MSYQMNRVAGQLGEVERILAGQAGVPDSAAHPAFGSRAGRAHSGARAARARPRAPGPRCPGRPCLRRRPGCR